MSFWSRHQIMEKNSIVLIVGILLVIAVGGLVEITPLFYLKNTIEKAEGVRPYSPLELAGRNIYVREGCYLCHSQMIRTLRFETQRYGTYSVANESVYDRPFQWGSKRTGPDLARVGGKYSDEWQRRHLLRPRSLMPDSNMPNYPWLHTGKLDGEDIQARMRTLRFLGDPYTDADIAGAPAAVAGKSELDAIVAYLQGLGVRNVATDRDPASVDAPATQPTEVAIPPATP